MGRSNRQTADYFPHYVGEKSRTKFILEKNWGNDGYAFWFKLLELLCAADGQYYDCWDKMGWEYLLAVTGVTAETAEAILNTLASMGKVDKELWESCRVIWVQSLLENLRQLYSKRTAAPTKPSVDNFPGRRVESPAQEPAADTEAEGTPPAVPEPAPEEHDKPKAPRRKAGSLSEEQAERFDASTRPTRRRWTGPRQSGRGPKSTRSRTTRRPTESSRRLRPQRNMTADSGSGNSRQTRQAGLMQKAT